MGEWVQPKGLAKRQGSYTANCWAVERLARHCVLGLPVFVACASAALAGPVVTVPLTPASYDDFIVWKPYTRTDRFVGSAQIAPPAPDPLRGTAAIGHRIDISVGGPVYAGDGVAPGPVSASFQGTLSSPLFAAGAVPLSARTGSVQVGGSPGAFGWLAEGAAASGFSPAMPTGWGNTMWTLASAPQTPPTAISLSSTVSGNAEFNSPYMEATVRFEEARVFFQPWRIKNVSPPPDKPNDPPPVPRDAMVIAVGARDGVGNYVPINEMARAMGFDHFNFVNIIRQPKVYDFATRQWVDLPVRNCRGQAVKMTLNGLYDPVPCGNLDGKAGDTRPYYYNVTTNSGRLELDFREYGVGPVYSMLGDKPDGSASSQPLTDSRPASVDAATGLTFIDMPAGHWTRFSTFLVGVNSQGFTPVGDVVYEWESFYGDIRAYAAVPGAPPPLPPLVPSLEVDLAVLADVGALDQDDEFDITPISFDAFAARYGLLPGDAVRAIQTELAGNVAVPTPGSLQLLAVALLVAAGVMRRRVG